jgi:Acetamidase/Formamidase family
VYLPVFVEGANLSMGDMHFSQGWIQSAISHPSPSETALLLLSVFPAYSGNKLLANEQVRRTAIRTSVSYSNWFLCMHPWKKACLNYQHLLLFALRQWFCASFSIFMMLGCPLLLFNIGFMLLCRSYDADSSPFALRHWLHASF